MQFSSSLIINLKLIGFLNNHLGASISTQWLFNAMKRECKFAIYVLILFHFGCDSMIIPDSEPILNSFPKISKPAHDEEDFPPGFEGQGCQRVIFAWQLEEIDGAQKKYDYMEGVDNYIDSIPDLESTDMPAGIFTDPNIGGSSPIISSSLFSSLALNDVSKLQHLSTPTSQTQTWKRLLFGKKKKGVYRYRCSC